MESNKKVFSGQCLLCFIGHVFSGAKPVLVFLFCSLAYPVFDLKYWLSFYIT